MTRKEDMDDDHVGAGWLSVSCRMWYWQVQKARWELELDTLGTGNGTGVDHNSMTKLDGKRGVWQQGQARRNA